MGTNSICLALKDPQETKVLDKLQHLEKIPCGETQTKLSLFGIDSPIENWKKEVSSLI